jgi:hypothetical protein
MKEDVSEFAVKIHVHLMENGVEECPDFESLFDIALVKKEIESTKDLHFVAFAIEQLMQCFDVWTAEWLIESKDFDSQKRDEDLLRGEI